MSALSFLTGFVFLAILLFLRLPLWGWLLGLIAANFASYYLEFLCLSFYLSFFLILSLFAIRPLRRKLITAKIFPWFKKVLPKISETEQAALEAGDTWWEAKLFQGLTNWQNLRNNKEHILTREEQEFIDIKVNRLCELLDPAKEKEINDLLPEAWAYIKQEKFFALIIPKEYGGLGFSAKAHSDIVVRIASKSISAAVTVMVPNSLGPAELLLHYGTNEQKQYYLPRLASAKEIPCFALTGPEAGSDAGAIPDTAEVCLGEYNGMETLGLKLNWEKRYITLAPVATVLGLAVKVYDPSHLLGTTDELGITLCLVPTNHKGVEIGKRHNPTNCSFMNGPTSGKDVFIPLDWVIGGIDRIGNGWHMLMECLAAGRGISLPALSAAVTLHAYKTSSAYAVIREQFNVPIFEFEGIKEKLGRIGGIAYIQEACRNFTLSAIDQGHNPAVVTAITKYHMTELGRIAINDAMDIHGGKTIICGPRNYLFDYYQSAPITITVEGANILTRNLIIFGQGAIRCHPYVLAEIFAANEENLEKGLKEFDKNLFAHIGYALSNLTRTFILAITDGYYSLRQINLPHNTRKYYRKLTRYSHALAFISDMAMLILGGDLKRKESLSARLGDVLSYLYIASAVLRFYEKNNSQDDESYINWAMSYCLWQIENAFQEFCDNFPNKLIGSLFKALVFPFGRKNKYPLDKYTHKIANLACSNDKTRKELISALYQSHCQVEKSSCFLEKTFNAKLDLKAVTNKINKALKEGKINKNLSNSLRYKAAFKEGIINEQELSELNEFDNNRQEVIAVD